MGLIFKAKGSNSIGLLLVRLSIGLLFLLAGARKAMDVEDFIRYVKTLGLFSDNISFILGFILPFAEIFFGALFIIGFMTPLTSIAIGIMTTGIIIGTGSAEQAVNLYNTTPFSLHYIILACSVLTLFSGAGMISFDALLDRKKVTAVKKEDLPPPPPKMYEPVEMNEKPGNIADVELKENNDPASPLGTPGTV